MNTIAVMLLQDMENDLLDISSTQTSFVDSLDSDSSKFNYFQINFYLFLILLEKLYIDSIIIRIFLQEKCRARHIESMTKLTVF